jgi:hypothetical protein
VALLTPQVTDARDLVDQVPIKKNGHDQTERALLQGLRELVRFEMSDDDRAVISGKQCAG